MSLLTINGIAAQVAKDGLSAKREQVGGGVSRAANGSARLNFQSTKWHPSVKCTVATQAAAMMLGAMLDGLGDHWAFDEDLYSDKGTGPSSNTGGTVSTLHHKWGLASLAVAASGSVTWQVDPFSEGLTVMAWFWNGVAFDHYLVAYSTGTATIQQYKNGALVGSSFPSWLQVSLATSIPATVSILGGAGATNYVDDLAVVPAYCDPSQVSSLYFFHAANAWPLSPTLYVKGDAMPTGQTKVMLGPTTGWDWKMASVAGGYYGVELQFDLQEV